MSIAYRVLSNLQDVDKETEGYQKMLQIRKLVEQEVKFPMSSPWWEHFQQEPNLLDAYKQEGWLGIEGHGEFQVLTGEALFDD